MAMIYSIRELAKGGKGIGRYRYIGQSDEQSHVIDDLCDCDNGHPTHAEAEQCPKNEGREWPDWRTAPKDRAIEHVKVRGNTKHPTIDAMDRGAFAR